MTFHSPTNFISLSNSTTQSTLHNTTLILHSSFFILHSFPSREDENGGISSRTQSPLHSTRFASTWLRSLLPLSVQHSLCLCHLHSSRRFLHLDLLRYSPHNHFSLFSFQFIITFIFFVFSLLIQWYWPAILRLKWKILQFWDFSEM